MSGVIDFIEIKMMRGSFIIIFCSAFFVCFLFVRSFGGILGWDPVHTTCIPDEMMMRL